MAERTIRIAHIGYGMFGGDVVAGTLHDLQRNGISPYLGRVGLDDYAGKYHDVKFEVVAIGEKAPEVAERAVKDSQELTGQTPKAYVGDTPWKDIVAENPDLDLMVVATPDPLHTPPVLEALRSGIHAITEKPMCLHLREADEMIELAEKNDLILGVDMHKRYDPDHLRIFKELSKDLGHPIYCRGVLEEPLEVSTSIFKWAEESDPFTYVGIHWVDIFMHYLQLRPLALYAVGQKQRLLKEFGKDAFDAVQVMVTHTNGTTVIYESNWLTPEDFESNVNQESSMVGEYGKVESDSQYRGLRYWIEGKGFRAVNTHFFRQVERPDGSLASVGYGKDSLVTCIEKVCRHKFLGVPAAELAGTYPDGKSQRLTTAVVNAAREVLARNGKYLQEGKPPVATASFGDHGITIHDPNAGEDVSIYDKAV